LGNALVGTEEVDWPNNRLTLEISKRKSRTAGARMRACSRSPPLEIRSNGDNCMNEKDEDIADAEDVIKASQGPEFRTIR